MSNAGLFSAMPSEPNKRTFYLTIAQLIDIRGYGGYFIVGLYSITKTINWFESDTNCMFFDEVDFVVKERIVCIL